MNGWTLFQILIIIGMLIGLYFENRSYKAWRKRCDEADKQEMILKANKSSGPIDL